MHGSWVPWSSSDRGSFDRKTTRSFGLTVGIASVGQGDVLDEFRQRVVPQRWGKVVHILPMGESPKEMEKKEDEEAASALWKSTTTDQRICELLLLLVLSSKCERLMVRHMAFTELAAG